MSSALQAYDQVLEEYANSGLAATFVRGIDLILQDRGGSRSTYLTDNLGSTRALTNSVGAVTDAVTYDAYGNILASTGNTTKEFLFTGQQFDSVLGEYYMRARLYDPVSGRFTATDPLAVTYSNPLQVMRYGYADDDPANQSDPSGKNPIWAGIGILLISNGIWGKIVQDEVTLDFLGKPGPPGTVRYPKMTLGQFFGGPVKIKGRGKAYTRWEPDLWEVSPAIGSIWEIKPQAGFSAGVRQLGNYLAILKSFDRTRTWGPGMTYIPPSVLRLSDTALAFVSLSAPGVITYQVLDMKVACATVTVFAMADLADTIAIATLNSTLAGVPV